MAWSPLAYRIRFLMPSGPASLSDGRCFSISLTSSLVGVLLSPGSGICESDGWGKLSVCVTRSASDSSQGERGGKERRRKMRVEASLLFQYEVPVVCPPLSTFVCQLRYLCEVGGGEDARGSFVSIPLVPIFILSPWDESEADRVHRHSTYPIHLTRKSQTPNSTKPPPWRNLRKC